MMALLFFGRSQTDARGIRYFFFFNVFPFSAISYWYMQVGGWGQRLPFPGRHRTVGTLALLGG